MWEVYCGDAVDVLKRIEPKSVDTCVTSPPYYGLRDYGEDGQIGHEESPGEYIEALCDVFDGVRDVLRDDGTLWVNIGDSYAGSGKGRWGDGRGRATGKQATNKGSQQGVIKKSNDGNAKPKDLIGIPWMLAFALRDRGWYLRQDIIWHKPNPMPSSVIDRFTTAHEYLFLLSKSRRYYFDHESVQEPCVTHDQKHRDRSRGKLNVGRTNPMTELTHGDYKTRNKRDVWTISTSHYKGAHFATFPKKLVEPCILAGSRQGGTVLDPFAGSCTTGVVAVEYGRDFLGIDINREYVRLGSEMLSHAFYQERIDI